MERTIKFRGKDIETGEWFFGNLFDKDIYGRTHICTTRTGCLKINPDTVGQFTGLLDKNGKEIYEGDILKFYDEDTPSKVVVIWRDNGFCFVYTHKQHVITSWPIDDMQVIGNIHDNPNLLEYELRQNNSAVYGLRH